MRKQEDQLPKIRMIEEHDADAKTREIYRDIKKTMSVPMVNSFFMTLAYYPDVLETFWQAVKPSLNTHFFLSSTRRAQTVADSTAETLFEFIDDYAWLKDHGFSREDMREIRYGVEYFHYVIPKMAVLSSHLMSVLHGYNLSPAGQREADTQEPDFSVKIQTVPFESAPREVEYIYRDIVDATGYHIINKLYTVLARWPEYLKHTWYDEIKPVVFTQDYRRESSKLQEIIHEAARQLPYPAIDIRDKLEGEAVEKAPQIAEFFDRMLPGEMIVVGGIRNMLVEGERAARAAGEKLERSV